MKVIVALLFLSASVPGRAQFTIQLGSSGCSGMGYVVSAANDDPNARTAQEIAKVNLALAAAGNTEADFQLGLAYLQGDGVGQDLTLALHYFELGATTPEDKSIVASMYQSGHCFARSPESAIHWYLMAGRPGDRFEAGRIYAAGDRTQIGKATELYRALLLQPDHPEARRAQLELGNLVIDGNYSAGDDAASHRLNLQWARSIAQELLGEEENKISDDFEFGRDGKLKDAALALLFLKRSARYNIDLAQEQYGNAILQREVAGASPFEGYAWIRLASDKRYSDKPTVQRLERQMTPGQLTQANSVFDGLVLTREQTGAYYPADDPLYRPSLDALSKMPDDDPDVQLRRAFILESSTEPADYQRALALYRTVRDRRKMDVRVVLGRNYLLGANGFAQNTDIAYIWFLDAANEGSHPAALLLARIYGGEGGGKPNPAQAYAWQILGGGLPATSQFSPEQKSAAEKQVAAWKSSHPNW